MSSLDSLRARAARIIMVRMGSSMPPVRTATDDYSRIEALCTRYPIGGVLLFNAAWPDCADTLARLQRAASAPILVGSDIERGVGQQVKGATSFPHALACGHASRRAVDMLARITALEAEACGIHWAFAPVADLRNEPRNPIIANRAFGDDTETVSRHVYSFVTTAQKHGLATAAKHAPGHGRTTVDSHVEQPRVTADANTLATQDAMPFRAAIKAETMGMMTAHVTYPALDPEQRPATASPLILQKLIRDTWRFDGVIVSDSLLMDGIEAPGERAALLLQAGVDMLLDPSDPEAVIEGIAHAVTEGHLEEARLNAAVERVERLIAWVQDKRETGLAPNASMQDIVGQELHRRAADAIAIQGIDLYPPSNAVSPWTLDTHCDTVVIRCSARPADADNDHALRTILSQLRPDVPYIACPADATLADCARTAARIHQADQVVAVLAVEPAAWQDFGLPSTHDPVLDALRAHPKVVAAATGSPHILEVLPEAWAAVATYSDMPPSQRALVRRLIHGDEENSETNPQ